MNDAYIRLNQIAATRKLNINNLVKFALINQSKYCLIVSEQKKHLGRNIEVPPSIVEQLIVDYHKRENHD